MDESQTLEALANIITELSDSPYSYELHMKHVQLVRAKEGMESEFSSAVEMMSNFYAVGAELWMELISQKEAEVDVNTVNGVGELLALYERAEGDYLSIPLLQKHLDFVLSQFTKYHDEGASKPDELGGLFSVPWTRSAIAEIVQAGIMHMSQAHLLWDRLRDWELERLEEAPKAEKEAQTQIVQMLMLARLRQPHLNSEETFQSYSTFTTNYQPASDYEHLLIDATKIRSQAVKAYERRERMERGAYTLDGYAQYVNYERQARNPDILVMTGVYERAIAEAAHRKSKQEAGASEALRLFWTGYCDAMRIHNAGIDVEYSIVRRAIRSVPESGEVWARYMRLVEKHSESEEVAITESVEDVYNQALSTNLIASNVEEIVPFFIGRASYERRLIESDSADDGTFESLVSVVQTGIDLVRKATGDPRLRLEKFLSEIFQSAELVPNSISVWESAAKHYKTSYLSWQLYIENLVRNGEEERARTVFKSASDRNLDWPEAIWEAWLAFEHLHGSVEEVEECMSTIENVQYRVNVKRAKEAKQAAYAAMRMAVDENQNAQPAEQSAATDQPMDVDVPILNATDRGTKRQAEEDISEEAAKKSRTETKPLVLKRDREHCTVFVAALPEAVTEEEITQLFKDCGKIREIKITKLPDSEVATVEFHERESVPQALTKDKKRLRDQELYVHLAWKSTLYVTNFPETADDVFIRNLFGDYGTLFDVRWPSKKFKNSRRFCYVQFVLPESAEKALELHGRELAPNLPLNVYISNPERKKDRTDHDADDKEVYVAGLSLFTTKEDLEKVFRTYGSVKDVRMALDQKGKCRGYAFVEFEDAPTAQSALQANNYELKKRRIAVTLSDSRARARNKTESSAGMAERAEARSRSVRIHNLPPGAQEGLLQQALEKLASVKRVEILTDVNEAVIELENVAEAGKLLLRSEPIEFSGNILALSDEGNSAKPIPSSKLKTDGMFIPRKTGSRPRAGLGHSRKPAPTATAASSSTPARGKGQNDFRELVG